MGNAGSSVECFTKRDTEAHEDPFPLIDCSILLKPDHPQRKQTLKLMLHVLKTRGYFYASNVAELPDDYIASVYNYNAKLHWLPLDEKAKFVRPQGCYSGPDVGRLELGYVATERATVRGWNYNRNNNNDALGSARKYPGTDVVQPGFAKFLDELYGRQNALGNELMVAFAEMLDLEKNFFLKHFALGDLGMIRLLHYPGHDGEADANVGISAHTDFEAFTLMHQDAPGLQFLAPDGERQWIDAPVRPAEFVVILGDVIERFTNGVLKATPHRVVKTVHKRNSIVRFNAVAEETLIEPHAKFVTKERPAMYTPVTMSKHMETTMANLNNGISAWDPVRNISLTAIYNYDTPDAATHDETNGKADSP